VLGSSDSALAVALGDLPTNIGFRPQRVPLDTNELDGAHYWSYHNSGGNFLYADGSVHFLNYNVTPSVFVALCTTRGNEVFTLP
jgi:prepilin-type processing-associated H-X9-DG protein